MAYETMKVDSVTTAQVPVCTVLHLTDPSHGNKPVVIGRSSWFEIDGARENAEYLSTCFPVPNRFAVYGYNDGLIEIWQIGKTIPIFEVL